MLSIRDIVTNRFRAETVVASIGRIWTVRTTFTDITISRQREETHDFERAYARLVFVGPLFHVQ